MAEAIGIAAGLGRLVPVVAVPGRLGLEQVKLEVALSAVPGQEKVLFQALLKGPDKPGEAVCD